MSVTTAPSTTSGVIRARRTNSTQIKKFLDQQPVFAQKSLSDDDMADSSPSPPSFRKHRSSYIEPNTLSFPKNNNPRPESPIYSSCPKEDDQNGYSDDPLVYANVAEIALKNKADLIDRQPFPPKPDLNERPLRVLHTGWREYKTLGGRSFFFHPHTEECQWKPPRIFDTLTKSVALPKESIRKPSLVSAFSSAPPDLKIDIPKPRSKSTTDQPIASSSSASTDSFSTGTSEMITHVTNPLIESELWLKKSPPSRFGSYKETTTFGHIRPPHVPVSNCGSCRELKLIDPALSADEGNEFFNDKVPSCSTSAPSPNFGTIYEGTIYKNQYNESSSKNKKWVQAYGLLRSKHFALFKDQKSVDPASKHYKAPFEVFDLRGAQVNYFDADKFKDKRHKHLISLHPANSSTVYLFSTGDSKESIHSWYEALRYMIRSNPADRNEPRSLSPAKQESLFGTFGRNSGKSSVFGVKNSIRQSVKNKMKAATSKDRLDSGDVPPRESIIDRLLRFLRSRPTIESLYERGIYKPEPIFGSTLKVVCEHDDALVPKFVTEIIRVIEARGMLVDGIYRVNGNLSLIQKIREHVNHDRYDVLAKEEDVHILSGALKLFFRELSEPVIPTNMNKDFINAIWEKNLQNRLQKFDVLLNSLPEPNKSCLVALVSHLRKVSRHSKQNRMNLHSLSIVFGPALFHESKSPKARKRIGSTKKHQQQPTASESEMSLPSHVVAYNFVAFGQVTEFILEEAAKFTMFEHAKSGL